MGFFSWKKDSTVKMKLIIVLAAVVAATAATDVYDQITQQAVRRAELAFNSQLRKRSVGNEERQVILAVRSAFIDAFKDKLEAAKDKLKDLVINGQAAVKVLMNELKDVIAKYKEATGPLREELKQKIQDLVAKLKDKLHITAIKNFLDKIKDDVLNAALNKVEKRYNVDYGFKDTMKNFFNKVSDHFTTFKDFMKEKLSAAWDAVQPVVDILKEMAITFIETAAKEASEKIIQEHKDEIGPWLWQQIKEIYEKTKNKN